ncbi:MAG: helix-turn-helix transcriptional regulator [Bacilli bacterium]
MTTGQKITSLRKKANITQEQLADLVKVSRQSV